MSLLAKLKRSFRGYRRPHRLTSRFRGRGTARRQREVHLILRTLQCVGTTGASREHSSFPRRSAHLCLAQVPSDSQKAGYSGRGMAGAPVGW